MNEAGDMSNVPSDHPLHEAPFAQLAKETVDDRPSPAVARGECGFADWVMLTIRCLRERDEETFRLVIDEVKGMGPIRTVLDLALSELPDPSTVRKAMDRLSMARCRRFLSETVTRFELGDVAAIDASGFDRIATSRRYARLTEYRFMAMTMTLLTDCESGAILYIHCTTSRLQDTQVGWQVLTRNLDLMQRITADKGYDWADLRDELRDHEVRPVIKYQEFDRLDKAHNARIDDDVYHRRYVAECSFHILKQRDGDRLTTQAWYR